MTAHYPPAVRDVECKNDGVTHLVLSREGRSQVAMLRGQLDHYAAMAVGTVFGTLITLEQVQGLLARLDRIEAEVATVEVDTCNFEGTLEMEHSGHGDELVEAWDCPRCGEHHETTYTRFDFSGE